MPAESAMQKPLQYISWQLGSAKQLSFCHLDLLALCCTPDVLTTKKMLVLGRLKQTMCPKCSAA